MPDAVEHILGLRSHDWLNQLRDKPRDKPVAALMMWRPRRFSLFLGALAVLLADRYNFQSDHIRLLPGLSHIRGYRDPRVPYLPHRHGRSRCIERFERIRSGYT